jgi:NAD(P)-dependent dehydrogenase (short-subunit alcohol dehydrogenase family)
MKKTILISGASSGLGFAAALLFDANGWTVVGSSTSREGAQKIEKNCPGGRGFVCDFRDLRAAERQISGVLDEFPRIDVLLNNTGIKAKGPVEDISIDEIEKLLNINVAGHFVVTRLVVPLMKTAGSGKIINISSTVGKNYAGSFTLYSASKHANTGFSKSLMEELIDTPISVSTVYPGGINTPFHEGARPSYLGPEEVAEAVYFIATRPEHVLIPDLVIVPKSEKRIP